MATSPFSDQPAHTGSGAGYLAGRWVWLLRQIGRRVWLRASLFSVAAVLTALLSAVVGPYVPKAVGLGLAAESVADILDILASSMLAVTTFAMTTMVMAFTAATTNVTPRATNLLVTDSLATNTLSTFVGSFLFAIVGIIGLSAELYGKQGLIVLFAATLVVVIMVAVALLRWIAELGQFGRVGDTVRRVEAAATVAARNWGSRPRLGARACDEMPDEGAPVRIAETGVIQHIDVGRLQELAEEHDLRIYLASKPGELVHPGLAVAHVLPEADDALRVRVGKCFQVGMERNYDQDPRFGLVVLSEIACRALSPGINDPGTAIQVLDSGARVLFGYLESQRDNSSHTFDRLFACDIAEHEYLEDLIDPIARDGAAIVEVQLRIQAVLEALAAAHGDGFAAAAKRHANDALEQSLPEIAAPRGRERLRLRAAWATGATGDDAS